MRRSWIPWVSAVLIFTCAGLAVADLAETPPTREDKNAESRKLLEEVLMARLTRELALDGEQTILLVRHMAACRDKIMALRRERAEKTRELRQAVRESKDEIRIGTLMDEVLALNERNTDAGNDVLNFDAFELTTWQRARLLLFMNDFENDMRRLLRRAQLRKENTSKSGVEASGEGRKTGLRGTDSKGKLGGDPSETAEKLPETAPSS